MLLALHKVLVAEALSILCVTRLVEVVHVELAHKTREVVVLEVTRQHFLGKLIGLVHYEACTR